MRRRWCYVVMPTRCAAMELRVRRQGQVVAQKGADRGLVVRSGKAGELVEGWRQVQEPTRGGSD